MYIGAHVSIAGGLPNAPKSAAARGCECFQIFTRSPRGGKARAITAGMARMFREACLKHEQHAWYVHTPYYVNLASMDQRVGELTVRIIREELERGNALGASAVSTHLGSAGESDPAGALKTTLKNIELILEGYRGDCRLLVENAAGPDAILGRSFEDLLAVVEATGGRCGVCLDTQHAFASGYDLRDEKTVTQTLERFDRVIGLRHLCLIHSNDSKSPLGSRKDRHEHIGKGAIGKRGFRALLADNRLAGVDFILETKLEGSKKDVRVLKQLRAGK